MPENMTALWQTVAAAVIAFVLLALAYSYVKYERLMRLARSGGGGGLTPHDAFLLAIARRLAIGSAGRGAFSVILLRLAGAPDAPGSAEVLPVLKAAIRRSDDIMVLDDRRIGAILDLESAHLGGVLDRWRQRLGAAARPGIAPLEGAWFGVAMYPDAGETGPELVEAAEKALADASARPAGILVGDLPPAAPAAAEEPVPPSETVLLDPLTGILREDKMGGAARKFIARCRRDGLPVSVLHVDICRLEDVNRRMGREAGDAVLRSFGALLSAHVRETDLIGRYGDDEFLAVLECAPPDAVIASRRLVECVRDAAVTIGSARVPFAVCIGIAGSGGTGSTPGHVIDASGTALRQARKQGPNSWTVYDRAMGLNDSPERETEDVF